MNTRKDPYTGELFTPRRLNQVYASRKNQVSHNNARAPKGRQARLPVLRILERNWQILDQVLGQNPESITSADHIHGLGFNFHYFTHRIQDGKQAWYGIFNLAYRSHEHGHIQIRREHGDHPND